MTAFKALAKTVLLVSLAHAALCQQQVLRHVAPGEAGAVKQVITPELTEFVEKVMKDNGVPGLALGVVHSNGTFELGAFGKKTEDDDGMTVDTLFDIASCSKAFLASAVGILIDDFAQGKNQTALPVGVQKLDWHTKLVDLFPDDWKLMDDVASRMATLRDILSHQSGLPRHDMSYRSTDKPIDVIRRMRYLRPAFELRQRWHYNNQFYMTGAHIVSTFSGMPYTDFVKERIFDPIGMWDTTYSPAEAARSGKLTQAWTAEGRRIPFWFPDSAMELNAGPGGVISNVVDLTKWIRTLLHAGVDPETNRTVIPRATYDVITQSHSIVSINPSQSWFSTETYGMGWFIKSYQGHQIWTHSGSIPGFAAEVFFLPNSELGIVTLANGDGKHKQELAVVYRIIEDYLGLERKESNRMLESAMQDKARQKKEHSEDRTTESASPAPPSLPLEAYAGRYFDPGYGNFTLCAPSAEPSEACEDILRKWSFFENTTDATRAVLYTAIGSAWNTHLRLKHQDGDRFALSGTALFPEGYGKDKSPFRLHEGDAAAPAEFMIEDGAEGAKVLGVALNGLVGETTEAQRIGGTIEQTAEIWLKRVST